MQKFFRSTKDSFFSGLLGGLAEYFAVDSSLLRFVWVAITVLTGFFPGVIIYLAGIIIVPKKK